MSTHRATIKATVANLPTLIVRGVVPLPKGYLEAEAGDSCPFTIKHPITGTEVPTQWEAVSFYPDTPGEPKREVASAEIIAHLTRGDLVIGDRVDFEVHAISQSWGTASLSADVTSLALVKDSIRLRVVDFYDNVYESSLSWNAFEPVDTTGCDQGGAPPIATNTTLHRMGTVQMTVENSGHNAPLAPGAANALQWLLGWHSYITVSEGSGVVQMTLNLHNSFSSRGPTGSVPFADPAGHAYFKEVSIVMPNSWNILSEWPEPQMGAPGLDAGEASEIVQHLVSPTADGTMNMMGQHHEREWRLLFYKDGQVLAAEEVRQQHGWGVPIKGTNDVSEALWSWQNPATGNYQAQQIAVPDLAHQHAQAVASVLSDHGTILNALATGVGIPYTASSNAYGYIHPYGVEYGGMAGGPEVDPYDGIHAIEAGIEEGLLQVRMQNHMYINRQQGSIYEMSGETIKIEDHLTANGTVDWNYFNAAWNNSGAFGFKQAVNHHRAAIGAAGLEPTYEMKITRDYSETTAEKNLWYQPVDFQHLIRYTRDNRTAVWIDNDPLAKRRLRMQAEILLMYWHTYPSQTSAKKLLLIKDFVDANPNKGVPYGREHAWMMDTIISSYAVAEKAWRERSTVTDWMDTIIYTLDKAICPSGMFIADGDNSQAAKTPFNGNYRIATCYHQCLQANALRGFLKSALEGTGTANEATVRNLIVTTGAPALTDFMWNTSLYPQGTYHRVAVGPQDLSLPVYANAAERPEADGQQEDISMTGWMIIGVAVALMEDGLTGADRTALEGRLKQYTSDAPDALAWFLGEGLAGVETRMPIIAWLQEQAQA